MLWSAILRKGMSDNDYDELLNGFSYELSDETDERAMLLLWDEAAEAQPLDCETDYDEPEEWWF